LTFPMFFFSIYSMIPRAFVHLSHFFGGSLALVFWQGKKAGKSKCGCSAKQI
jgi:hypothetical protein